MSTAQLDRTGWWPDRPTVGLLMAGFFGVNVVAFAFTSAGFFLSIALTGSDTVDPSQTIAYSTVDRVIDGAAFCGTAFLAVAAIGGLLLFARHRAGVAVAVTGLAVAVLAHIVGLVGTLSTAPAGSSRVGLIVADGLQLVGYIALAVVVIGTLPRIRFADPPGPISVP